MLFSISAKLEVDDVREEWLQWEGLTEEEAARRLVAEGYNQLPAEKGRGLWGLAKDVLREPMFLLLLACGGIYLLLGDVAEAALLLGFVFVVAGITLYQECKAERALDALRDLSSPRAAVIRSGELRRIAGRDVVRGDLAVLQEGDRVPADGVVLAGYNLLADESLLTGESAPVQKIAGMDGHCMQPPGGEDSPCIFSGTLIVRGQGVARIVRTGPLTEMGKIGRALQSVEVETAALQQETGRMVRLLAVVGIGCCSLVTLAYGFSRGDWLQGILAGITLAMAMLPEEFPVVLAVFLALGAWRLSGQRVLARRMAAVESLGATTVLCVDKTGTLTENRMSVQAVMVAGVMYSRNDGLGEKLPEEVHELIEFAILASQKDPFDPMEKAIRQLGELRLADTEHWHEDWILRREYPLSADLLALSLVWQAPAGEEYVIAAKGAPEAIADLCHFALAEQQALKLQVLRLAEQGLRVLGVAKANFAVSDLPGEQHDFAFSFLGLVGLADPVRAAVPAAVRECRTAGIRMVMITGDYPETARNIGRQIGLAAEEVLTGAELDALDDEQLRRCVRDCRIFARVTPAHKLRLVEALKTNGEIVAMTGDGVNDGPALKAAHIGVAMGGRGTDVAREAAALVLVEDDFSSLVQAVKMGRRIFDNLRKALGYIFAIHVPIAGISLIPVLIGWPLVLLPVHVVFLELVIDPACAVVFEAEEAEPGVMHRPPRSAAERLFSPGMICAGLAQGAWVLAALLGVFSVGLSAGRGDDAARAMAFATLVLANVGLIVINRAADYRFRCGDNRALLWVGGGALIALVLVLAIPFLRGLFHFSALMVADVALCLFAAGIAIAMGAVCSRACSLHIPSGGKRRIKEGEGGSR